MLDLNQFKMDDTKKQGVWVDLGNGAKIKVASADTGEFSREWQKMVRPYESLGQDVSADVQESILCSCVAKHLLLDWEGISEGSKTLKYSVQNAERVLKEVPWFRARVVEEAKRLENFRKKVNEEIAGN